MCLMIMSSLYDYFAQSSNKNKIENCTRNGARFLVEKLFTDKKKNEKSHILVKPIHSQLRLESKNTDDRGDSTEEYV